MREMLQPDSVFDFGKYKGKTVTQVFEIQPSYLCWMRKTGFSAFGKAVTEAIFAWEEAYPEEVKKVEVSIEKRRVKSIAEPNTQTNDKVDSSFVVPTSKSSPKPASWGSW